MKTTPDIMLLPSKLSTMAKEVGGTVIINPGYLSKGSGGGTFAEILVHPLKEADLKGNGNPEIAHKVHDRTVVNVIKI